MNKTVQYGFGLLGKSPPDYRDYLFAAPSRVLAEMPEWNDLRTHKGTPRIFDQQSLGSCTANATNAMVQYVEHEVGDPDWDRLSRLWTYYWSRDKIGTINEDSGAFIRDSVAVAAERGIPRETFWPYNIGNFALNPSTVATGVSSAHHKVMEYRAIPEGNEQAMQACIAEGYPFVYGFAVYDTFWEIGNTGVWDGGRGSIEGYHAVAVWGYDFRPGSFGFANGGWIIRNSWGVGWGDKGYFYVPRSYMSVEAFDMWTIRRVSR